MKKIIFNNLICIGVHLLLCASAFLLIFAPADLNIFVADFIVIAYTIVSFSAYYLCGRFILRKTKNNFVSVAGLFVFVLLGFILAMFGMPYLVMHSVFVAWIFAYANVPDVFGIIFTLGIPVFPPLFVWLGLKRSAK
jgi:hypothetical protein